MFYVPSETMMMVTMMMIWAYNSHVSWLSYSFIPCSSLIYFCISNWNNFLPAENFPFSISFSISQAFNKFLQCLFLWVYNYFFLTSKYFHRYIFYQRLKYAFLLEKNKRHVLCRTIKKCRINLHNFAYYFLLILCVYQGIVKNQVLGKRKQKIFWVI